ncbi:MAG: putative secreted protein, partial [Glaciihabitans sp.]|nr:putative secreted protein [Glaciihabitans sp.]
MRNFTKLAVSLTTAGILVAGLAACSSTDNASDTPSSSTSSSSSSTPSESATPTPVASIPALDGVDTQVTLDAGFLEALTTLGLTPGVLGTATLSDAGVLAFPITGGNVDYYDPAASYRPYVQGEIDHDGSGISLTAGDTVVELTDFRIDPGTSQLFGTVTANGTEV